MTPRRVGHFLSYSSAMTAWFCFFVFTMNSTRRRSRVHSSSSSRSSLVIVPLPGAGHGSTGDGKVSRAELQPVEGRLCSVTGTCYFRQSPPREFVERHQSSEVTSRRHGVAVGT